jgi:hypothetical protein
MRARASFALVWLLALVASAGATGMVAQTFSRPDIVRDFGGFPVAEHRGDVLVGAPCSSPSDEDFVYLFDATTGATKLAIPNPNGSVCERFGWGVASDGEHIIVSSPFGRLGDHPFPRGVVYVFDGTSGALVRVLPAPDFLPDLTFFGDGLLVAGADYFVLASGFFAVDRLGVVLRIDAETGAVVGTYENEDGGEGSAQFGPAMAVAGGRLLVGHRLSFEDAVLVFDIPTGARLPRLLPPGGALATRFGASLAVANGRIAVGAPSGPGGFGSEETDGAVHFFDATTLDFLGTVPAPEVSRFGSDFGAELGVLGGDFLVGAPFAAVGDVEFHGAAYLLGGTTGELLYRFHAPGIGTSIAGVGGRALVGARFFQPSENVAYLFETCASLGEGVVCDDGNACDTGDRCEAGLCRAGTPVGCDGEALRCRVPGCEPATGICHQRLAPFGAPCFGPSETCSRDDVCDGFGRCVLDPDPDPDRDRVCSLDDTCPNVANTGQEDADGDARGDVCDSADSLLVLHDASVRASRGRPTSGKIKVRGEFLSRADHAPFDPGEGLTVRLEDDGSSFAQVFVWLGSECSGAAPARAGCRHADRPASRIDFRPLAHQIDGFVVYRFTLDASDLEIEQLPVGPLAVTITSQPPRPVSGFDRAGAITGCSVRRTRFRCRVSAGAP